MRIIQLIFDGDRCAWPCKDRFSHFGRDFWVHVWIVSKNQPGVCWKTSCRSVNQPGRRAERLAINPATKPALNPASMLTTVTFAAQLLSIPRSGARPPKLAP